MSRFSLLNVCSVLLISISLMFASGNLFAAQVTLTWDPVADSTVQGYKVYYGTASRTYPTSIDVKNVTTYALTGLSGGTTYYLAVTAYSSSAESAFSSEVSYATPQSCAYSLSSKGASFGSSGGAGNVTVNAPAGCVWNSSTPPNWLNLTSGATGTGNGSVVYSVAPNNSTSPRTVDLTIAGQVFTVAQAGPITYTINATAGAGGLISPSGTVTVAAGRTQTFNTVNYPGHTVADIKVDGVSVGAVLYHIFSNVVANHTISVSFY